MPVNLILIYALTSLLSALVCYLHFDLVFVLPLVYLLSLVVLSITARLLRRRRLVSICTFLASIGWVVLTAIPVCLCVLNTDLFGIYGWLIRPLR